MRVSIVFTGVIYGDITPEFVANLQTGQGTMLQGRWRMLRSAAGLYSTQQLARKSTRYKTVTTN